MSDLVDDLIELGFTLRQIKAYADVQERLNNYQ